MSNTWRERAFIFMVTPALISMVMVAKLTAIGFGVSWGRVNGAKPTQSTQKE